MKKILKNKIFINICKIILCGTLLGTIVFYTYSNRNEQKQKDIELKECNKQNNNINKQIKELKKQIKEKDNEVNDLRNQIEDKNNEINNLNNQIVEKNNEINRLKN